MSSKLVSLNRSLPGLPQVDRGISRPMARQMKYIGEIAGRVTAALGPPSFSVKTEGASSHEIWIYYFQDGTLTVNLTDGYVARAATEFGPPKIRKSRRP